jgi:hypothetical protein
MDSFLQSAAFVSPIRHYCRSFSAVSAWEASLLVLYFQKFGSLGVTGVADETSSVKLYKWSK